ncbi:MAG TPA: hypothetical protein VFP17_12740 [Solirubrobacterales bacterium]|nr:hypothetical protein [Solirubrobacterales bacterium]
MNDRVGKAALKLAFRYLRRRYQRPAGIAAAGLLLASAGAVAYWLRRDVPEG